MFPIRTRILFTCNSLSERISFQEWSTVTEDLIYRKRFQTCMTQFILLQTLPKSFIQFENRKTEVEQSRKQMHPKLEIGTTLAM